jgi:hypothetical protein
MKAVYNDPNITLRNMRMMHFDPGHDIPTLIDNLAKRPKMLDLQDRTLIARIIALTTARKDLPTTVMIGISDLTVLSPMLVYFLGNQTKQRTVFTLTPTEGVADNTLARDLLNQLRPTDTVDDLSGLVAKAAGKKDFLIALMPMSAKDEVRSVIDMLTAGRPGILLIKDYGLLGQTSHHEYCRDRGLRIVQLPDGSGELCNLAF